MADMLYEQEIEPDKTIISHTPTGELSQNVYIHSRKDSVTKTFETLKGVVGSGTFGGHLQPLTHNEYLAGTTLNKFKVQATIKLEPIKHVNLDSIKVRVFAVFCPNVAIFDSAKQFVSQKTDIFGTEIISVPTVNPTGFMPLSITNMPQAMALTTLNRDSIFYSYYGNPFVNGFSSPLNILLFRGYKKIWNEIFRPKNYASKLIEYTDDVPTQAEINDILGYGYASGSSDTVANILSNPMYRNNCVQRISATTNYWNDYRLAVYSDNNPVDNTSLFTHNVTQQMIDEYRTQEQNSNLTDAEVIANLRGTYQARETLPQIIGQFSQDIDLSIQPQTNEGDMLLGDEGAISYTHIDRHLDLKNFVSPYDGYVHYFWTIQAPDNSIGYGVLNLEHTKTNYQDFYRPAMAQIKDAPLYNYEIMDNFVDDSIAGWKRRYSEYFRLPTIVRGDYFNRSRNITIDGVRTNPNGWASPIAGFEGENITWIPLTTLPNSFNAINQMAHVNFGAVSFHFSSPFPTLTFNTGSRVSINFTSSLGSGVCTGVVVNRSLAGTPFTIRIESFDIPSANMALINNGSIAFGNQMVQFWNFSSPVITSFSWTNQLGIPTIFDVGFIESKTDWTMLRSTNYLQDLDTQDNYSYNPQTDYTDVAMQQMLIFSGQDFNGGLTPRPRDSKTQTPYTFKLYGSVALSCSQPIDSAIKNNYIAYGDE